jgi:hypothetical protein
LLREAYDPEVIRYGSIQVPRAAISALAAELSNAGEGRLAHKLGHAIDQHLDELVLGPDDYGPILRLLSERPLPTLEEFQQAVEAQFRQGRSSGRPDELVTAREARLAANEAFFRELNERLEERAPDTGLCVIVCECSDEDCAQRLTLSRSEYETVRSDPTQFVVAHDHVATEIEEVVATTDRYEVVRKLGVGAVVATELHETGAPEATD